MPRRPESKVSSVSEATIRSALAQLKPPTEGMLLDRQTAGVLRKLDTALKRGRGITPEVRKLVDGLGSGASPIMYTRGGTSSRFVSIRDRLSLTELLSHLYLPTDDPTPWVPPQRRYFDNQIAWGAAGSASAYKNNGKLTTIQSVDLNSNDESTWAGVFIYFRTDLANYGQVSQITFQPDIDWTFRDWMDSNPVWTDRVAHLNGWVRFIAYVWLTGYEFNVATNKFETLTPPSGASYQVHSNTWWVSSLGSSAGSGSLRNGAATFKFIASPARLYALGAWIQLRASHTVKNAQGGPIPQPGPEDFTEYALFKAVVPEMWLDHQVFAW